MAKEVLKKQVKDNISRPILAIAVSLLSRSWIPHDKMLNRKTCMQTRLTDDLAHPDSSNQAETQPSAAHSFGQNAAQSLAGQMISPPPSRPATPELPPVPPPSPTFSARAALLSRPCIPNYSLYHYHAASAPSGGNENGLADKVSSICSLHLQQISSH